MVLEMFRAGGVLDWWCEDVVEGGEVAGVVFNFKVLDCSLL